MADYSFVVSSTYNPFTLQEMLVPYQLYGEAFNKAEEQAIELQKNADEFSYLADTLPEGSKARTLYESYANDLKGYSNDLGANGLSISNRRGIANMRRRYSGEIGRLKKADDALQEERTRRLNLSSSDPTMLYATENLSIDDFLDRKEPNRYNVSGQKLYERGLQIGASDSSRIWSDPKVQQINKYYQDIYTTSGRDSRVLAEWRANLASIPELNSALESTLKEMGVTGNLTGVNYERAKESVINGIINGSTYKRADSVQRDLGVFSAPEAAQVAHQAASLALEREKFAWQKQQAREAGGSGGYSSGSDGDTVHRTISKQATRIKWHGNDPDKDGVKALNDYTISTYSADEKSEDHPGHLYSYDKLPASAKAHVDAIIGNGAYGYYDIFYQPFISGGTWHNDIEADLEVVPRALTTDETIVKNGTNYSTVGK